MKRLTIEGCDEVAAKTTHTLVFPLHKVTVVVRALEVEEAQELGRVTIEVQAKHGPDSPEANRAVEQFMASQAMVDDAGKQTHNSEAGRAALAKLPELFVRRIANAIGALMGVDGVDIKNS